MKLFLAAAAPFAGLLLLTAGAGAQTATPTDPPPAVRRPPATPTPAPKLSETLSKNVNGAEVPREKREEAYAKLLEGQRYVYSLSRLRGSAATNAVRLARLAFQRAVELNPNLAEGYTALAELVLTQPSGDINEAISLAALAVRIDRDNFGSQRILARLYTIKSRLSEDALDPFSTDKAVAAWKDISRLDPRNAEAWAFLAEFHRRAERREEQIAALKSWLSSTPALDPRFYMNVMGREESLAPEAATIKLGSAYLDAGRIREAVELLNQAVGDDPDNSDALSLLGRALEKADAATAATSEQAIRQAMYANPDNTRLVALLANVRARSGGLAEAAKLVGETVAKLAEKDKNAAASLQLSLGDIYRDAGRTDEAAVAYRKALVVAGLDANTLATDADRELALGVQDRIINAYKTAGRIDDAKTAIEASRKMLGDEDSYPDRQLIALFRDNGRRAEALQALKFARIKFPEDYGFLRQQAQVLTELGRVDEGVELIRGLIGKKPVGPPTQMYDDFTNYLFISLLYGDAKRGPEAVAAANKAYEIAGGEERRQIAKLQLATAQQKTGDFRAAETTLREILAGSPNNPVAANNLGYFLADRNEKLDEALKLIQQALRIEPDNPSYLDSLGWVYFKMNKLDAAEKNLRRAIELDPTNSTLHDHLGDVYLKQNKAAEAKASWEKALTLASDPEETAAIKAKLGGKPGKK